MIAKHNRTSLALGIPGMLIRIAAIWVPRFLGLKGHLATAMLVALLLLGTAFLFAGLVFYAKAKGRSGWWAVFAILGIFGLIVLACLKDKTIPPPIHDPLQSCPACNSPYRLDDYEPDAPMIRCSKCKTVLPRG